MLKDSNSDCGRYHVQNTCMIVFRRDKRQHTNARQISCDNAWPGRSFVGKKHVFVRTILTHRIPVKKWEGVYVILCIQKCSSQKLPLSKSGSRSERKCPYPVRRQYIRGMSKVDQWYVKGVGVHVLHMARLRINLARPRQPCKREGVWSRVHCRCFVNPLPNSPKACAWRFAERSLGDHRRCRCRNHLQVSMRKEQKTGWTDFHRARCCACTLSEEPPRNIIVGHPLPAHCGRSDSDRTSRGLGWGLMLN